MPKYHGESLLAYFTQTSACTSRKTQEICPSTEFVTSTKSSIHRSTESVYKRSSKSCPFYKRIPGTQFTVDAFSYGNIAGCDGYFLSHFHSDHYRGLNSKFVPTIYCSKVTKALVQSAYGKQLNIVGLELNVPTNISGVDVTAIDANHCPGSVMFLFHVISTKQFVLHTGDFRFHIDLLTAPSPLATFIPSGNEPFTQRLHSLYLDTTYCSSEYDFPSQDSIISGAVRLTSEQLQRAPKTLVICGMYSIGKERFVCGLAEKLNLKVWLSKQQHRLVKIAAEHGCSICAKLMRYTVIDPSLAQLHVLSMSKLSITSLCAYRSTLKSSSSRPILAWRPTGWSHQSGKKDSGMQLTLDSSQLIPNGLKLETAKNGVRIYGAAYSEHSSYRELEQFLTALRPTNVHPTVFGTSPQTIRMRINQLLGRKS